MLRPKGHQDGPKGALKGLKEAQGDSMVLQWGIKGAPVAPKGCPEIMGLEGPGLTGNRRARIFSTGPA